MKKISHLTFVVLSTFLLIGCSNEKDSTSKAKENKIEETGSKAQQSKSKEEKIDFNSASDFEAALKEGQDTAGKTVTFVADNIIPDGTLGYTIWAGEHLNFISTEVLGWKVGESHTVKVKKVASSMGSFMITFENIK